MPAHCAIRPFLRMLIHGPLLLMHELLDFPDPNLFGVELSGTLTKEDHDVLASELRNHLEQHTTTRALFVMDDVNDWEPDERWKDLAFDIRHLRDLDKVAIVGDDLWETWLEKVELLFPMSTIQTYAAEDREEAVEWLRGDMEVPGLGPGSKSDPDATAQDADE